MNMRVGMEPTLINHFLIKFSHMKENFQLNTHKFSLKPNNPKLGKEIEI